MNETRTREKRVDKGERERERDRGSLFVLLSLCYFQRLLSLDRNLIRSRVTLYEVVATRKNRTREGETKRLFIY